MQTYAKRNCGYFPFHHDGNLNLFIGDKIGHSLELDNVYNETLIPNGIQFGIDATTVQIGDFIWIIGGTNPCGEIISFKK